MRISTRGRYAVRLMLDLATNYTGKPIRLKDVAKRQGISDKYLDYANQVNAKLNEEGIRSSVDSRAEKIGYKIRDARLMKVPYMLIVGAKEEEQGLVSVRSRFAGDEGQTELASFVDSIKEEVRTRALRETVVVEEEKKEK